MTNVRRLEITDLERIERFRTAGYGGAVADALRDLGIRDTALAAGFTPIRAGMLLAGRALPVKIHTVVEPEVSAEEWYERKRRWGARGDHPQQRLLQRVADREDGTVLCFDCGGDMRVAHIGEMTCQLASAQGCRGMVLAGNCRDVRYLLTMADFPVFSQGVCPTALGGWTITDVDEPVYLPGHLTYYVAVAPEDFLFGDEDGVQVIPGQYVDEVLLRVEEIFADESKAREAIASGMPVADVYREYGVL